MLEWTHRKIQNKSQGFSSLADAYDDLLYDYKDDSDVSYEGIIQPHEMKSELMPMLEVLGLQNVDLQLCSFVLLDNDLLRANYEKYRNNIPVFLRLIGENCQEECQKAGMSEKMIARMGQGLCPENYTPHLKLPIEFGGMANLSNFSLVKTHPIHDNLHQIFDVQLENGFAFMQRKIFVPVFEGNIYYG